MTKNERAFQKSSPVMNGALPARNCSPGRRPPLSRRLRNCSICSTWLRSVSKSRDALNAAGCRWSGSKGTTSSTAPTAKRACSSCSRDIYHFMHHLIHWNEFDRGGHFAAFEQPVLFTKNCAIAFALCADTLMVTLGSRGAAVIDECGHDS